ncbi:MAG TPA: ABC transporter ATP-binding protein [Burkholderiales bacterium]|nr:ABC transporter ATP-binding protein [Burkholderiales bacterium]
MLELKGLQAGYGRARVLFGVHLEVNAGEVAVLLGRNGAGKSTTLKAAMGLLAGARGERRFEGRRIDGLEPFEIARLGLGYVPEDRRIFTDLTVGENLEAGRRPAPAGRAPWTTERIFKLFPALSGMERRSAAHLSGGEQQMLTLARTLMGNPKALLLDEPSEGLAPRVVDQMVKAILELKRTGLAVLLCEQNTRFARRVGDRAYWLEQGRVRRSGDLPGMQDNPVP